MSVSTAELLKNIQIAMDMGEFTSSNKGEFLDEAPHAYLHRQLSNKQRELSAVCTTAELDTSYCYRIFSGARVPSRNALIHLALSMGLSVEEAQHALRLYGLAALDPRRYRDAAILFAISKRYTIAQTNELLHSLGEEAI